MQNNSANFVTNKQLIVKVKNKFELQMSQWQSSWDAIHVTDNGDKN